MSETYFETDHVQFQVIVESLTLTAFRGFQGVDIDFNNELTVFISKNGGGKTTILDAVWEGVKYIQSQLFKQSRYKPGVSEQDVNNSAESARVEVNALINYQEYGQSLPLKAQLSVIHELTREQGKPFTRFDADEPNLQKDIGVYFGKGRSHRTASRPIFEYHQSADQRATSDSSKVKELTEWVDRRQKVLFLSESNSHRVFEAQLSWLQRAVSTLLSENAIKYENLRVDYREDGDYLVIDKITGEQKEKLSIHQLSSGERSLLGLVTDLAISLIDTNPSYAENPLEEGFGVVLIDEVGIHLHPSWQRKVLIKLTDIFPKVQFIATTHSPLVLSGIRQEQGRLIKDFQCFPTGKVKGRDASSILEDEFGEEERPAKYQEKIERFYRLLTNNREEAEKILDELKQIWPENDDEIIRAESYLDIF